MVKTLSGVLKKAEIDKIKKEAEIEHSNRMQSLDFVPPWVLAARNEEHKKKELKIEGGSRGERGG